MSVCAVSRVTHAVQSPHRAHRILWTNLEPRADSCALVSLGTRRGAVDNEHKKQMASYLSFCKINHINKLHFRMKIQTLCCCYDNDLLYVLPNGVRAFTVRRVLIVTTTRKPHFDERSSTSRVFQGRSEDSYQAG